MKYRANVHVHTSGAVSTQMYIHVHTHNVASGYHVYVYIQKRAHLSNNAGYVDNRSIGHSVLNHVLGRTLSHQKSALQLTRENTKNKTLGRERGDHTQNCGCVTVGIIGEGLWVQYVHCHGNNTPWYPGNSGVGRGAPQECGQECGCA